MENKGYILPIRGKNHFKDAETRQCGELLLFVTVFPSLIMVPSY